jgi:hypothetical protein
MTETTRPVLDAETEEFAQQIADQVESFLIALKAVAVVGDGGRAISPLLLEISQVLLAGARLGAQRDFTGLRHYRLGNVAEALWWWQFSYVSSWGNLAGAALNALVSIVTHDRLDVEIVDEDDQLAAADEMLDSGDSTPR